jgi:glycosyltransferase involved in cell wall biosynthesis
MVDILAQDALYRLVAAADSVVMPSLSEGLSITAVEAMSMAKPVVLTAVGGNVELVEDRVCGLLVPPRDSEALAQAICDLHNDRQWAREMGVAARKRLGVSFDLGAVGRQWADELKFVAAEYAPKAVNS